MSAQTSIKDNTIKIEIDASGLTPQQIRLLRTLNTVIAHVVKTDDEEQYFEGSAEFMRICASLIKQSNFTEQLKSNDIPYAQQALEYSMDVLHECITNAKVVTYDN